MAVLQQPPATIATAIANAAERAGLPQSLVQAVAWVESRYKPTSVSNRGAMGLMQIMPANVVDLGIAAAPFDPGANAAAGARMLASLYKQLGSWESALAAYNWGIGNVTKHPTPSSWPAQVRQYVHNVLSAQSVLEGGTWRGTAAAGGAGLAAVVLAALGAIYLAKSSRGRSAVPAL